MPVQHAPQARRWLPEEPLVVLYLDGGPRRASMLLDGGRKPIQVVLEPPQRPGPPGGLLVLAAR
eukprot:1826324-Lingulodinium_polyedra.AAC.1